MTFEKKMNNFATIDSLPNEVMMMIFDTLNTSELVRSLSLVSRRWNELVYSQEKVQNLCCQKVHRIDLMNNPNFATIQKLGRFIKEAVFTWLQVEKPSENEKEEAINVTNKFANYLTSGLRKIHFKGFEHELPGALVMTLFSSISCKNFNCINFSQSEVARRDPNYELMAALGDNLNSVSDLQLNRLYSSDISCLKNLHVDSLSVNELAIVEKEPEEIKHVRDKEDIENETEEACSFSFRNLKELRINYINYTGLNPDGLSLNLAKLFQSDLSCLPGSLKQLSIHRSYPLDADPETLKRLNWEDNILTSSFLSTLFEWCTEITDLTLCAVGIGQNHDDVSIFHGIHKLRFLKTLKVNVKLFEEWKFPSNSRWKDPPFYPEALIPDDHLLPIRNCRLHELSLCGGISFTFQGLRRLFNDDFETGHAASLILGRETHLSRLNNLQKVDLRCLRSALLEADDGNEMKQALMKVFQFPKVMNIVM